MSRGVSQLAAVARLPEAAVVAAAVVTQLGDVWFLFGLLGLIYWFGEALPAGLAFDRRRAAFLVALGLGANVVTTTLKGWLAYPRPPGAGTAGGGDLLPALVEPLYASAATATGFGFPSGHALGTTMVYGGLALLVGTGWPGICQPLLQRCRDRVGADTEGDGERRPPAVEDDGRGQGVAEPVGQAQQ